MPDPAPTSSEPQVDLTNCDREQIHLLGHVQSFGCLLAVTSDWMVAHASANCADILGRDVDGLIGTPFTSLFSSEVVHFLRSKMQTLGRDNAPARVFAHPVFEDGQLFDLSIHSVGSYFIFEFEHHITDSANRTEMALVQPLIARIQQKTNVLDACEHAARGLKVLSGIDRVMVYRFEPDGSGTVVAEARDPEMDPFLGLRYPATDIPKQARALYERQLLRIICDVEDKTYPILPEKGSDGEPLDLSMCVSRAVSPIHLEYLRNMGVAASMSVSILRRGKLWGLFACHHREALRIDYEKRSAIELFAQMFAYELTQIETDEEFSQIARADALHDTLISQISTESDLTTKFDQVAELIADVIPYDGMAIFSNGTYRTIDLAPSADEFEILKNFLNTAPTSKVIHTISVRERFPTVDDFERPFAGLMAIPISKEPRDYLLLFRQEIAKSVKWAGNPEKPVEVGPDGSRLTPRKSFDAWQQIVKNTSSDWRPWEIRSAEALRVTFLEVILKLTADTSSSHKRVQERQELLIAELNHRVRNILNLIRGLVGQGKSEAETIAEYAAVLDTRIHALARAHDQLTQENWGNVSIDRLIENEVAGFASGDMDRVRVTGDALALAPTALTNLALVIHELLTNSRKYGALSGDMGHVEIDIHRVPNGGAAISWRERGGPPVGPPHRRGFGTTIIERSIPFELKGTAELRFVETGVEADFLIPENLVETGKRSVGLRSVPAETQTEDFIFDGRVLILDDNLIIAMDTVDILTQIGADDTRMVGTSFDALKMLDEETFDLALLDVNLGSETSIEVAKKAVAQGVPCILATGYNTDEHTLKGYPSLPLLKKPFTEAHVRKILAEMRQDGRL